MSRSSIPSVDRLLDTPALREAVERNGRILVVEAAREEVDEVRRAIGARAETDPEAVEPSALAARIAARAEAAAAASLRPVFNVTGTVLHTNLGRASLAAEAVEAVVEAAMRPSTLEYDVDRAGRGDRDSHVEGLLRRLTGAEAATVVNNNAAAVLLVLSTLAKGREVPVSRGELVEIGGSFRMPDVMAEAGCILREVGTTNRTHPRDFAAAFGEETALALKVHTSNYAIQGFTAEVSEAELAALCRERGIPFAVDLGSGALLGLERFGIAHETTVEETLAAGADLVTFSGDKLLGGPQAGLIVGRSDLIARIKRNPLKRALRLDKMTLAALAATLALYLDPDRIAGRLPTLRHLTRPADEIAALCADVAPAVRESVGAGFEVGTVPCLGQIGSGALPVASIPSHAIAPYGDDITVLINSPKLGHIRSIDRLYSHVRADWIFHCEDDWQFFRAGFIAESFAILGASETVSMVALRALSDFKPGRFGPDGLAVDISAYPCAGLQFNPGLRRLGDYRKIGPYARLGGRVTETTVSSAYAAAGLRVALLPVPAVRHIGDGRHAHDPLQRRGVLSRLSRSVRKRVKRVAKRSG